MSYAVAMNICNTDTRIARKSRGFIQILFFAVKNNNKKKQGSKMLYRDSICPCYAILPFSMGYYQSKEIPRYTKPV